MTAKESIQRIAVHTFLGLAALQFFLAGLGTFRHNPKPGEKIVESSTFDPHRIVGDVITLVALIILVMAIVTRRQLQLSIVLFVLMLVQHVLAGLGEDTAVFGALHALNGVALLAVGVLLLVRMRPAQRAPAV
jgi:hypothetical protein